QLFFERLFSMLQTRHFRGFPRVDFSRVFVWAEYAATYNLGPKQPSTLRELIYEVVAPHTTSAEGNGAGFMPSPNRNLPRSRKIFACIATCACHHCVSVRAGSKATTVASPFIPSRAHFDTHRAMLRPYGGLQKTSPRQSIRPGSLHRGQVSSCLIHFDRLMPN